ncbi:MAG: hypothetical protein AAF304_00505 [Pseudomonadota bacterium]
MEMKKLVKGLIIAGTMAVSGSAIAATQGTLGGTSQGDIDIDVTVGDQIQITALQDITGSHVPGNDFTGSSTACVYTNNPTGNYDVTMTSSNPGGANEFQLNGPSGLVVYNVSYNDGNSSAAMLSGQVNTTFDNADTASPTCGGTPQSSIDIVVPAANLDVVGAGTYSDVVTILVSPR